MNLRVARFATVILLLVAGVLVYHEVTKRYGGQGGRFIKLTSPLLKDSEKKKGEYQNIERQRVSGLHKAKEGAAKSSAEAVLKEIAANGPPLAKGGKGLKRTLMMTLVDKEAAQALLPVFLRSLRAVSAQLDRRLVVMAMDAEALESCRKQHAYCLPWFQRTTVEAVVNTNRTAEKPAAAGASLGSRALLQGVKRTGGQAPAFAAAGASGAFPLQRGKKPGSRQPPAPAPAHLPPGWQKVAVLQQLLGKGYNVLAVDVDLIWLREPFGVLEAAGGNFLVSADSSDDKEQSAERPCAGVIFARATEATRALVRAWAGLGREEGGVPSALFPRAWASTQSNYQNQLQVSYLPAAQFPNGCGLTSALKEGTWDTAQLPKKVTDKWVVWHAACIKGMQQKLSALTGLMTALKKLDTSVPSRLAVSV